VIKTNSGWRSPQTENGVLSSGANALDGDASTSANLIQTTTAESSFIIFSNFDGLNIPYDAVINGIKFKIRAAHAGAFAATKLKSFWISKNGASGTFSQPAFAIAAKNLTNSAADYTVGTESQLWGINWTNWADISQLAFRFKTDQQSDSATTAITGIYTIYALVHYTIPHTRLKVNSGKLTFKSGNHIIK
jgi:hypothetical protein